MSSRIILFGPLPPPHGGVSIYMATLAAHLRDSSVRVWSYTGTKPGAARARFISHRRLGTFGALLSEGRNARILDASHFHFEYPNPLLLLVWLSLKKFLHFEWYKNVHDGSLPKRYVHFGRMRRWLLRRAVQSVDTFVVVSEELRDWLQAEFQVRQPVLVVPPLLPAPAQRNASLSDKTKELLKDYLEQSKRVCSIGVFIPTYGFRDVAEAVEELRLRTGKDIGLLLLDGGFACDDKYRDEVSWKRDWITVLQTVPNEEIYPILKRSDVFVRAFRDESYGISRIEALWSGIPVVATRAGETRGMLLYDFGDVEQLVSQLQAVLLYPVQEETNPWAAQFRREAEENLTALRRLLEVDK